MKKTEVLLGCQLRSVFDLEIGSKFQSPKLSFAAF
jgi:hypothetical protein